MTFAKFSDAVEGTANIRHLIWEAVGVLLLEELSIEQIVAQAYALVGKPNPYAITGTGGKYDANGLYANWYSNRGRTKAAIIVYYWLHHERPELAKKVDEEIGRDLSIHISRAQTNVQRSSQQVGGTSSIQPALVIFENRTAQSLSVLWVDAGANEHPYFILHAHQSFTQETYVSHLWNVRSRERRLVLSVRITKPEERFSITDTMLEAGAGVVSSRREKGE